MTWQELRSQALQNFCQGLRGIGSWYLAEQSYGRTVYHSCRLNDGGTRGPLRAPQPSGEELFCSEHGRTTSSWHRERMDEHGTRNVKAQLNGLGCTETDALGTAVKASLGQGAEPSAMFVDRDLARRRLSTV